MSWVYQFTKPVLSFLGWSELSPIGRIAVCHRHRSFEKGFKNIAYAKIIFDIQSELQGSSNGLHLLCEKQLPKVIFTGKRKAGHGCTRITQIKWTDAWAAAQSAAAHAWSLYIFLSF